MSGQQGGSASLPAAWYDDPRVPGQQRFWDGARWTEHVARAAVTPAGWYADPQAPGRQRYWDGASWTEHVATPVSASPSHPKAGWFADPSDAKLQRYWDGSQWTNEVRRPPLIDAHLHRYLSGKTDHVVLTEEHLGKNDERVALADITAVNYGVTQIRGGAMNGTRQLDFAAATPQQAIAIRMGSHVRKKAVKEEDAYHTLVDVAQRLVEPRLVRARFARVQAGEAVQIGKLVVNATGVGDGKKHHVPWSEVAQFNTTNFQVEVYRHHDDGSIGLAFKVPRGGRDATLAPGVLNLCTERFGR